jgi:hypothetical protein
MRVLSLAPVGAIIDSRHGTGTFNICHDCHDCHYACTYIYIPIVSQFHGAQAPEHHGAGTKARWAQAKAHIREPGEST